MARARLACPLLAALLAAGLVGLTAACGGNGAASPQTVTVIEKTVVTTATPAVPPPPPPPVASPSRIRVPNVVGKNHQLAQDTMQSVGLYNLLEEDATGQGRMLLWDRNWVVVSQDPPAGTMVGEDQPITLRSKKIGE